MVSPSDYANPGPTLDEVQQTRGALLLEFGTSWCGHCSRARPHVAAALAERPEVVHVKVEDGSGRPLGRAFGVKLWPTLVLLRDGREEGRLVRPTAEEPIRQMLGEAPGA